MLRLHGFALSNYYNKVKIVLIEKGVAFEEVACRLPLDEAGLRLSPMGKIPFLELDDGSALSESGVILEYLEDRYPSPALLPADPLARARVRELARYIELHLELVARRLYAEAFFGGKVSDEVKIQAEKDLDRGVRGFMRLAKCSPFVAGDAFTLADCAAAVHLPLVSLASKTIYGRDVFEAHPRVRACTKMLFERPSVKRVNDDRKAWMQSQQQQKLQQQQQQ